MSISIDVIYFDGEVIGFDLRADNASELPELTVETAEPLEFRFCDIFGERVTVAETQCSGQLLLTWHDRVLASQEKDVFLETGEDDFQILRSGGFSVNTRAVRQLLHEKSADCENIDCELSAAIFAENDERLMQLFFTVPCRIV